MIPKAFSIKEKIISKLYNNLHNYKKVTKASRPDLIGKYLGQTSYWNVYGIYIYMPSQEVSIFFLSLNTACSLFCLVWVIAEGAYIC